MSDIHNTTTSTTAPAVDSTPATEPVTSSTQPETTSSTLDAAKPVESSTTETPALTESKPVDSAPITEDAAPVTEEKKEESAPAEKVVEPISHGQLGYKGPGLLKSLIPSKKEFWLSDDSVSPQSLNSFMRGEKPEVANPIVAWASQTGKGLLFFNKKGNTVRKSPESVLALYEATDLKKQSPHEIAFKLNGHEHVLKASSDNERDGWYQSIEKSMELGKAQKEEVRESESYKSEMEKLNKPNIHASPAAAAVKTPKKSTEVEKPTETQRKVSDAEDDAGKKDKKSRSTSRGLVDRLKGKKEEQEVKREEKKIEKEEKKEAEKDDSHKTEAATAGVAGVGLAGAGTAAATSHDSPVEPTEKKVESVEKPAEKKVEEPKQNKRGSIFGRIGSFGGVKSPLKEKDQKDAELKPEVPPKDDAAPQLPPPATETPAIQPAIAAVEPETPAAIDTTSKPEEPKTEDKKDEVLTPSKEKNKFLSGLSFMKRDRSVSPSATKKEEPVKTEPVKNEPLKTETEAPKEDVVEPAKIAEPTPAKIEEPVTEAPATTALPQTTEKAAEPTTAIPTEETQKEEKTADATPNKRNSVFGNLGRRASKAFKGIQGGGPKKENTVPKTEEKKSEVIDTPATNGDKPLVNGEHNKTEEAKADKPVTSIGDVVPDAIETGKPQQSQAPPTVAASA